MNRITAMLAASALAACATPQGPGAAPALTTGLTSADIEAALADPSRLAALDLPTVQSDLTLLDGPTAQTAGARLAAHGASEGHDTYALTMPPAFAGLGGPQTAVSLTSDLASSGWADQGSEGFLHRPSGMTCPHGIGLEGAAGGAGSGPRLELESIRTYDAAGMDTSCNYVGTNVAAVYTLFASRWPDVTLRDHFEQAAALMPRDVPVGAGAPVPIAIIDKAPAGTLIRDETLGIAYTSPPTEGRVLLTTLYLNKVGDWHVKMRATHTPPAEILQVFAAIVHIGALIEVDEAQRGMGPLVQATPVRLAGR